MYYIGIDLGTSAVKLLLMDETGKIANIVSREYPLAFPHPGWSEQNPAEWWTAVCDGIPALLDGLDAKQIRGIGAGGQMHGLVVLDKNDAVIRPCILWNDGRTQKQVDYLNEVIGKDKLSASLAVRQRGAAPRLHRPGRNSASSYTVFRRYRYLCYLGDGALLPPCADPETLPAPRRCRVRPLWQDAV